MNDDAAGKIENAQLGQKAVTPDHVHEREIDKGQPADQEQQIRSKTNPVRKCTGDQRRGDDGEHHLVGHEDEFRNISRCRRAKGSSTSLPSGRLYRGCR